MQITKNTNLKEILKIGKECDKCNHCCSFSSGFILPEEIEKLAKKFKLDEKKFIKKYCNKKILFNREIYQFKKKSKPFGSCMFLTKKGCKINKIKPLHCRIGNCKKNGEELSAWFTVNYLLNLADPESIRQFSQYEKSGGKTIKGGRLKDMIKDKEKLQSILNYKILRK